ncbi:MAG: amino acid ABC transporter ATP-binding protein [Acidimicrobiia bacterium]|nr:amino acid ABC transporter ATP-binding protein [Acidimicrobiia bacterium]
MTGPVLDLRAVAVEREGRRLVEGMSLGVARGELVALMGPSGSGKTSVLRAVAGLDPFVSGEIEVGGVRLVAGARARRDLLASLYRQVGIVFQFHNLFENLTALENVCLAPVRTRGVAPADAVRRAQELLASLGVAARAGAYPHELSGGEAQRVAIARALAMDPPLLLMDEPTASLDAGRRGELAATLRSLAGQGRALLVATHDAGFVGECRARVVTIDAPDSRGGRL